MYYLCTILQGDPMLLSLYIPKGKSCHKAHLDEQTLTEAQEEILVKWIKIQGRHGVPMTYASVGQCAEAISGWHIGGSWPKL
jgi:hypothetical protein